MMRRKFKLKKKLDTNKNEILEKENEKKNIK